MDSESNTQQQNEPALRKSRMERILISKWFGYMYMMAILVYLLLCGYVLVFSGSLFLESVTSGWYKADASEYDSTSFMLGYLYGFASLLGVLGGLSVLVTKPQSIYKFKVLFFIPSVVWSVFLVLDLMRYGLQYWTSYLLHLPIMVVCVFALYGVVKKVNIPYFGDTQPSPTGP